jgi:non-ribosomal peptide synthase protein (TIGR01720 family)
VVVDVEGHGREDIVEGADLSRTVGWFTSLYPVRLDPGRGGPGEAVRTVKEQLRAIPDKGIGYGMLRYLDPRHAGVLGGYPAPQLGFNYLGRFPAAAPETAADFSVAADDGQLLGGGSDAGLALAHVLEVNAITEDGPQGPRLRATWAWAPALLAEDEVRDLAALWFAALAELATHVRAGGGAGVTPSDLALAGLSQDELDDFDDDDF